MGSSVFSLCEDYNKAKSSGTEAVWKFFENLLTRKADADVIRVFALEKLDNFTVEDGFLVAHGCYQVLMKFGQGGDIKRLRKIRYKLPALPGMRDYRVDFDELVSVLEARQEGRCDCQVRTRNNISPKNRLFRITAEESDQEQQTTIYHTVCTLCGVKWTCVEDPTYHFPLFNWTED